MLDKLLANPILFYGIFAFICILVFLTVFLIVNKVKKMLERKKLKDTSEIILNDHYEEPSVTTLEEEINKLEEKAKQNENVEAPVVENFETENTFIKGQPIHIEINSDIKSNQVESKEKNSMQSILNKMQQDLTKKDEAQILEFEQEQEENAIISYQELLKANGKAVTDKSTGSNFNLNEFVDNMSSSSNNSYSINEFNTSKDLSIITIDELDDTEKQEFNYSNKVDDFKSNINENSKNENIQIELPKEKKKFKMSEFISPIYGIMETKLDYPKIPSESKNKEKSISDLTDDEFLKLLKAFRENL